MFLNNIFLLGWAANEDGRAVQQLFTPFSAFVFVLFLVTGLVPAFVRPQYSHSLAACFSIFFAFFLLIPFELSDLPTLQPGKPLYYFLDAYLILRLTHAAILLPMALHVSVRFPRVIETSLGSRPDFSGAGGNLPGGGGPGPRP